MGSCYSGDHIAGNHIYTDITTCNTEVPQQKYCLETVSDRLQGLGMVRVESLISFALPSASAMAQPNQNKFRLK